MAKTIDEGFSELLSNLEISDLQESTVSIRQKNVRAAVEDGLTVLDTFLAGSYRRSTMIAPLSEADVDIFVVLDAEYFEADGQAALLDRVKRVLRKTYTKTPDISRNGQAVTIVFTDFKVDVVPTFHRKGGGFLIPDSQRGEWIATDPKKHIELWTAANKTHKGDLVPLIKILKGWNKSRDLLRSFHLEVLILSVLNNMTISNYPSGVRYVFDKAREKIPLKLADPAGYSDDVAAYINTQSAIDTIVKRLDWAYERSKEAEALAKNGEIEKAFAKWALIFKDYFPAYR
jgi:Second Messenger Oligonucleotide or Dinucleotide Synthetase domain